MNLAIHHPETLRAAFPIAGWLPPSLEPRSGDRYAIHPPIFAYHGEDDRVLSASRTRELSERIDVLGFPIVLQTYANVGHETSPEMREALRIEIERTLQRMQLQNAHSGMS